MPSFTLTTDSNTPQTLADGEFGTVQTGVTLDTDSDAIDATGSVVITANGRVISGDEAVDHSSGFLSVAVGAKGRIAGDASGIYSSGHTGVTIENEGRIAGFEYAALELYGSGPVNIVNEGKITGRGVETAAIILESDSSDATIQNSGTISGEQIGIYVEAGNTSLVNRGTLEGGDYAYDGWNGYDYIKNYGTIEGGVFLRGDDDYFENRKGGSVDSLDLGGGDDVYWGRGDSFAGTVKGGGGFDVLVSSKSDDVFEGGGASDRFYFMNKGGDDVILDFTKRDVVFLLDLDELFNYNFRQFKREFVHNTDDGALIDLGDLYGLTILLAGVEKSDLKERNFALSDIMSTTSLTHDHGDTLL